MNESWKNASKEKPIMDATYKFLDKDGKTFIAKYYAHNWVAYKKAKHIVAFKFLHY